MVKNVEADQASKNVYEVESSSLKEGRNNLNTEFLKTFQMLGLDESQIELSDDVVSEPVEMLVNLANGGDIDPWDIDIVDITDKFLDKIEQMKLMDLRISARTLLYASILLRMKSTGIIQEEEEDEVDEEPDSMELEDEIEFSDVEDYPVPKLPVRRNSKRPVTLNELVTELKKAEKVESRRKERKYSKKDENSKQKENESTNDVLDIAHEEDITGRAENLNNKLEELLKSRDYVLFSEIVNGDRSEKVMTYISLLFLATDRKINLNQEELFGELYIHPGEGISQG